MAYSTPLRDFGSAKLRAQPPPPPGQEGSAQGAEPQSEERNVPKSSLRSNSEAVAFTHLKQADQRRHMMENGDSKIPLFSRNHCSLSAQDSEGTEAHGRQGCLLFRAAAWRCLQPAGELKPAGSALRAPRPCLLNFRRTLGAQGERVFCL